MVQRVGSVALLFILQVSGVKMKGRARGGACSTKSPKKVKKKGGERNFTFLSDFPFLSMSRHRWVMEGGGERSNRGHRPRKRRKGVGTGGSDDQTSLLGRTSFGRGRRAES